MCFIHAGTRDLFLTYLWERLGFYCAMTKTYITSPQPDCIFYDEHLLTMIF